MHSWEIIAARRDSLLISLIVPPGGPSIDWALSFRHLQAPPIHDILRWSGYPWGESRTQAGYELLNRGNQYLFFLDMDVICPPDTITRLMAHRLPIVSGLYRQRFPTWTGMESEYLPCMFNEVRDAQGNPARANITDFQYGQLVQADFVPGGCLLVHRIVFEKMLEAGIKRFFEWTLTADNPQGRSEDFEWCARARSIGFRCFCDSSIQCTHEAPAKVDMKGLSVKL